MFGFCFDQDYTPMEVIRVKNKNSYIGYKTFLSDAVI